MQKAEFDPTETIGGFPLLKIQGALFWVGIKDDRDDVARVAEALECPRSQAERVLAACERRGLVTPTPRKNQWKTTELGRTLTFHWKRPPRLEPIIRREGDDRAGKRPINEVFDSVPCSLLHPDENEDDTFEEANLTAGVFVEYASPRVIEVSVEIPRDYDDRDSGGTIETSVYLGVDEAKRFARALATAIARGEAELARRASARRSPAKPHKQKKSVSSERAAPSKTTAARAGAKRAAKR